MFLFSLRAPQGAPGMARALVLVLLAILANEMWATEVCAENPVVRVEEDWELQILNPDPTNGAPQVSCVISPQNDTNGMHAVFALNYRGEPYFQAGGMQLQLWNGSRLLSARDYPKSERLSTDGESVRWTQCIRLHEGNLVVEVINGSSTTWGTFGGQGYLMHVTGTAPATLNGYSPTVSTNHSGIGFASNRVTSLVLKEVRCYLADGTVQRSSSPRVVHQK